VFEATNRGGNKKLSGWENSNGKGTQSQKHSWCNVNPKRDPIKGGRGFLPEPKQEQGGGRKMLDSGRENRRRGRLIKKKRGKV